MPRAFLVHWDATLLPDLAEQVEVAGWSVAGTESADVVHAAESVARDPPDAVLIWLTQDAARGRRLGLEILTRTKGVEIPLVFLGGSRPVVRLVRRVLPGCLYVDGQRLPEALREAKRLGEAMRRASPAPVSRRTTL